MIAFAAALLAGAAAVRVAVVPADAQDPSLLALAGSDSALRFDAPDGVDLPADRASFALRLRPDADRAAIAAVATILAEADGNWLVVAADSDPLSPFWKTAAVLAVRTPLLLSDRVVAARAAPAELGLDKVSMARATKDELIAAISSDTFEKYLRQLTGDLEFVVDGTSYINDNRWTFADGNELAGRYIHDEFERFGFNVSIQEFSLSGGTSFNLIAERVGSRFPNEIVILGAHFDSVSEQSSVTAPGAEDNGSGIAGVLAVAEALAAYQPERTIQLLAFGAEEQGLVGSSRYVDAANRDDIVAALTMDMISFADTNTDVIIETERQFADLANLLVDNFVGFSDYAVDVSFFPFGSDHIPFLRADIPATLAIDSDWDAYDFYHRSTDTYDKITVGRGAQVMKGIAAAFLDLAGSE